MTQLELVPMAPALTRAQRLAMIRAAHRRWAAREARVDRIVRIVAPPLRDDEAPEMPTLDVLDEIVRPTVMMRAAGGEW